MVCYSSIFGLGNGIKNVNLVFNEIYENKKLSSKKLMFGSRYVCLRDEFYWTKPKKYESEVKNIFISFGGTDPHNLTCKVLKVISKKCIISNIKINVVCGPGYKYILELEKMKKIEGKLHLSIIKVTDKISKYMQEADLAFIAAGRTVYELTAMQVPSIVICSNRRETTHNFANSQNGILNIGLYSQISNKALFRLFSKLVDDKKYRYSLHKKIKRHNLKKGKFRVINKIKNLLDKSKKRHYLDEKN